MSGNNYLSESNLKIEYFISVSTLGKLFRKILYHFANDTLTTKAH